MNHRTSSALLSGLHWAGRSVGLHWAGRSAGLLAGLLLLALGPLGPAVAAEDAAATGEWLTELAAARAQASKSDRLMLVDLFAEWCTWCKVLEKEVFTSAEFRRYAEDYVLLRVDTEDGGEGSRLQAQFGAYTLPTLLILDKNMALVGQVQGYAPTDRFLQNLQLEVSLHRLLVQRYQQVVTGTDLAAMEELADEFHARHDGARAATLYRRLLEAGELGPEQTAWTRYHQADALRLQGDFEAARQSLHQARELARRQDDRQLLELTDFLTYQIAEDRGDCEGARDALETFVESHPASPFLRRAQRVLRLLEKGKGLACA
jgi:thiol-disulfide isomerase/thioredoxin